MIARIQFHLSLSAIVLRYGLPVVVLFICNPLLAQFTISGKVVNANSNKAIPYVNIGIPETTIGSLSNEDGSFQLTIPEKYHDKNLIFSSVSFERKSISIIALSQESDNIVRLQKSITELREVVIYAEPLKKQNKTFGNGKSLLLNGNLVIDSVYAGAAMALLIDKSAYPDLDYVQSVSLYIAKNLMPRFKVRLRFLSLDTLNSLLPGEDLIKEEIICESSIKKGWLNIDLNKAYRLNVDQFYLTFEWILNQNDRKFISDVYENYMKDFPDQVLHDTIVIDGDSISRRKISKVLAGTIFGTTNAKKDKEKFCCYTRDNSFGKWERLGSTLSARINFANYPSNNSQQAEKPDSCQLVGCIDQWLEEFRNDQNIPGIQLSVLHNDSLFYSNAIGYKDKENQIEVSTQTQFRIASLSKAMTAAAIMKLVKHKKLNLDEDARTYASSFPKKAYTFSTRQLLSHTAGIRDYYELSIDEILVQKHFENATEALELFDQDSLLFPAGEGFLYSSFGYMLLGAVIEGVSGKNYLDFMQSEIWDPLSMNNTFGEIKDSIMVNKSRFYLPYGDEAPAYDLSYSYPSGGLLSTSEDLLQFATSLYKGKIFEAELRDEVFTVHHYFDKEKGYGLGWYIGKDASGRRAYYHAGELPSSASFLLLYPEQDLVLALLANAPIISEAEDGFSEDYNNLADIIFKLIHD